MRVLHFCSSFSVLTETFIYDQLCALDTYAGDQHVVAVTRQNAKNRPFPRVHALMPTVLSHVGRLGSRMRAASVPKPGRLLGWPVLRGRLRSLIQKIQPDILHAHFGPQGVLLSPIAQELAVPLVTSFYGYDASMLLADDDWRDHYQRLVFSAATVSLSQTMAQHLMEAGAPPARLHVVRLGKRVADYPYTPSERVRRFLSVGRMAEKKGHMDAIAAFTMIAPRYPDATLDLVGDGPLRNAIQRRIRVADLRDRVTVYGALSHDQVRGLMKRADAFILCSKRARDGDSEGTPTVLLEAQATGLPCISTFHGGIPETVPVDNHHLLAQEGDVPGLADRMEYLLRANHSSIADIAERGIKHVTRHYNTDVETPRLITVYGEAMQRGS